MKEEFIMKNLPKFKSDQEEQEFWASNDSIDFLDWDDAEPTLFPKLKPTTKTISIRLSQVMLAELRSLANKRDVPYQSLIKMFLQDKINQEIHLK